MFWFFLTQLVTIVLDMLTINSQSEAAKDLELLALRQQIRILQRRLNNTPRLSRLEKLLLAVVTIQLKKQVTDVRTQLAQSLLLFKPDTILKWHRELVKRKWSFRHKAKRGRPPVEAELEALSSLPKIIRAWVTRKSRENCSNWAMKLV